MFLDKGRALIAISLAAGLLLSGACMLFICPVVTAAGDAPESCHSAPGDKAPADCPYTVMQPVFTAPLLDRDLGQDDNDAEASVVAATPGLATSGPFHASLKAPGPAKPPGTDLHVRLCVFRI
jgi:hypothetical protein